MNLVRVVLLLTRLCYILWYTQRDNLPFVKITRFLVTEMNTKRLFDIASMLRLPGLSYINITLDLESRFHELLPFVSVPTLLRVISTFQGTVSKNKSILEKYAADS